MSNTATAKCTLHKPNQLFTIPVVLSSRLSILAAGGDADACVRLSRGILISMEVCVVCDMKCVATCTGVGGGSIDTRQRLSDFPEGAALADLER